MALVGSGVQTVVSIKSSITYVLRGQKDHSLSCPNAVVVLLHGWLGSAEDLSDLAESLAQKGFCVIVPDLPWHGDSFGAKPRSISAASSHLLQDLSFMLRTTEAGFTSVSIVGYSLGGRLAVEMARELSFNDSLRINLRALILISSASPPKDDQQRNERKLAGNAQADAFSAANCCTREKFKNWLTESWYAKPMWADLRFNTVFSTIVNARLSQFSLRQSSDWEQAARIYSYYESAHGDLKYSVPVLYMHGEDDKKYASIANDVQDLFSDVEVISICGAGHNILAQKPVASAEGIIRFLQERHSPTACKNPVKIDPVKLLQYSLSLENPMMVGGQEVYERKGILLGLSSGIVAGIGDICPLPGLHTENLGTCFAEISTFEKLVRDMDESLCPNCTSLARIFELTSSFSNVVQNGITCALLHMFSQVKQLDFALYAARFIARTYQVNIEQNAKKVIAVGGVLPRACWDSKIFCSKSLQERIGDFADSNSFRTLKVKVGTYDDAFVEGRQIAAVLSHLSNTRSTFRLDANRAWDVDQFERFQDGLGETSRSIEFIEEPLRDNLLNEYLSNGTPQLTALPRLPLALDESLCDCSPGQVRKMTLSTRCRALVIKPAVLGSLQRMLDISKIGLESNCTIVMSTVFDSGVGIAWTSVLAAVIGESTGEVAHGVGTFSHLKQDVVDPTFEEHCVLSGGQKISIKRCEEFMHSAAQRVLTEGVTVN